MMTTKTALEEDYIPLTDTPLFSDWDEPIEAYPNEEDEDEQDIE